MSVFLKCVVFVLITIRVLVASAPMMSSAAAMSYMKKYGYASGKTPDMKAGIASFQKMMQMNPTGVMDQKTSDVMLMPRCGMIDMKNNKPIKSSRWNKNELSYKVMNYPNPERSLVNPVNVNNAISQAFEMWANVTNVVFTPGGENDIADIDISFQSRNHGHNDLFDGPTPEGQVLAHAGPPNIEDVQLRGDIHFDNDEAWVLNPSPRSFSATQFNILYVAVHEIGHSLGLSHTDNTKAIMNMMYKNSTGSVKLNSGDIERIQMLYGPRRITSRIAVVSLCDDPKIDAAFNTADGSTYMISGRHYWKLTSSGLVKSGYPKEVGSMWVNAPASIDAAFTNLEKKVTFFIQGSKVWRYASLRSVSPVNLTSGFNVPLDSVDAVYKGENQPTYFFKDEFKGVPDYLDAAVMFKRKENQPSDPVFFKGLHYYYRWYEAPPGKAGRFLPKFNKGETKALFGCPL